MPTATAGTTASAYPTRLIPERHRVDREMPDDGSLLAALRRGLALKLYRDHHPHPGGKGAAKRERAALAGLTDLRRDEGDMDIIAAGLAEMDIDDGSALELVAATHRSDMGYDELQQWAKEVVHAMRLAVEGGRSEGEQAPSVDRVRAHAPAREGTAPILPGPGLLALPTNPESVEDGQNHSP